MQVQPYLFLEGRAEEAIEFYRKAVGAEVVHVVRNKENPEPAFNPPNSDDKILHSTVRIGDSLVHLSDGQCTGKPAFQGFSLSLTVKSEADADRAFNALSAGGQVHVPLSKTFFSPRFGMLADKFGIGWMVYVAQN
jgi:PhnB protein